MKYHDSIKQANKTMTLAVAQLNQWRLPVNPINYAVSYEYCKNKKPILTASIKRLLLSGKNIDGFFMEQLYKDHLLEQSQFRDDIITDLSQLFAQIQDNCQQSTFGAQNFIDQLDDNIPALMSHEKTEVKKAIAKLHRASTAFKKQQQQLVEQLQQSQIQTKALEEELEEVRQEIYLDPVTGLYNRKAMSKHVDTWLSEDAERGIAAIVINVDHFAQFNERFGVLIGDVILSKIAKKVASYVDDSGLPVRSANDEFIVLFPDVDNDIASEIAEKIKQGVDKIRFVSVKSGVRLPKMSISCGTSEIQRKESLNQLINRTRKIMQDKENLKEKGFSFNK
ncbi:GGDEF domain-containing protein [Candidatus Colwellia aromaticivorans]|uniref:GGDEF domain-containing protein n=1 Tax=Candidatus Colwellia aromaticivorans TaxID=2267621 RepID=UPI00109B8624|nr:GGDEF domain-containing protein [Candidatus Colwellia aromaticivorans]